MREFDTYRDSAERLVMEKYNLDDLGRVLASGHILHYDGDVPLAWCGTVIVDLGARGHDVRVCEVLFYAGGVVSVGEIACTHGDAPFDYDSWKYNLIDSRVEVVKS